ncbi:MAG TPA: hypothetical protein VNC84_07925 [Gammaproteobacteria bacterium]|jgi:hypothetical protein|nr:hypothetical protein [Gammaproteobacteria bacterium]
MTKPAFINSIRSDLSDWLVHCTQPMDSLTSFDVLRKILNDGVLIGNKQYIKAQCKCVCFSEAPLTKIKSLITYCGNYECSLRYAPYGIAVKKEWLFERGGRPVIYQKDEEFDITSDQHKYRHVRYDPAKNFDFTWEREWRVQCNELVLQPEITTVFVKDRNDVRLLLEEYHGHQSSWSLLGVPFIIDIFPWGLISLDEIS